MKDRYKKIIRDIILTIIIYKIYHMLFPPICACEAKDYTEQINLLKKYIKYKILEFYKDSEVKKIYESDIEFYETIIVNEKIIEEFLDRYDYKYLKNYKPFLGDLIRYLIEEYQEYFNNTSRKILLDKIMPIIMWTFALSVGFNIMYNNITDYVLDMMMDMIRNNPGAAMEALTKLLEEWKRGK